MVGLCVVRGNRNQGISIYHYSGDSHTEPLQDYERARQIYQTVIKLVPHKIFTFAKLWLLFAKFEVRRLDLPAARKILGAGIGMCPKEALFKAYIQLELDVGLTIPRACSGRSLTPLTNSFENSTASGQSTKNISNGIPQIPPLGSSSRNWNLN